MNSIEQTLIELEASMRRPENRTRAVMTKLLAEEFVEFGSSGRTFTKAEVIPLVEGQAPLPMTASDFKVQMLSDSVGFLTYRVVRQGEPPLETRRSSIWRLRSGVWQLLFHQGTIIPKNAV